MLEFQIHPEGRKAIRALLDEYELLAAYDPEAEEYVVVDRDALAHRIVMTYEGAKVVAVLTSVAREYASAPFNRKAAFRTVEGCCCVWGSQYSDPPVGTAQPKYPCRDCAKHGRHDMRTVCFSHRRYEQIDKERDE